MYSKSGFMAIKLDMSKVYDIVHLHDPIFCFSKWRTDGWITPMKGIRQGNPISPYLFIICEEALSSLLSRANRNGTLRGVPTFKKEPQLNHLLFADDNLLFCGATISQ
jgi:hypothetical protein